MTADALDRAYAAASALVAAEPLLSSFATLPPAHRATKVSRKVPAISLVEGMDGGCDAHTAILQAAIREAASLAEWNHTYTEAEVGADFLARYGWFELAGPTGHFRADDVRAYVAYWGEGLTYDWHHHEAEELYYIIAGEAVFEAEGEPPRTLHAGEVQHHKPFQPHAMTTHDHPVLTFVLWRGAGLTGIPRMGRA